MMNQEIQATLSFRSDSLVNYSVRSLQDSLNGQRNDTKTQVEVLSVEHKVAKITVNTGISAALKLPLTRRTADRIWYAAFKKIDLWPIWSLQVHEIKEEAEIYGNK